MLFLDDANIFPFAESLKRSILNFFAIWWIWIVVLTMLWMEFWNRTSLFRIAFVVLVMIFVVTFQVILDFQGFTEDLKQSV